ncbi:hypothetical protein OF83DRAFT_1176145 [Amylostereum chailletii]|nr:hypothetical protein OF83DRAFT_1176145 [Amylostereum chailletii]
MSRMPTSVVRSEQHPSLRGKHPHIEGPQKPPYAISGDGESLKEPLVVSRDKLRNHASSVEANSSDSVQSIGASGVHPGFLLSVFNHQINTLCNRISHPHPQRGNSHDIALSGQLPLDSDLNNASRHTPDVVQRAGHHRKTFTRSDPYSKHPMHTNYKRTVAQHFLKLLRIDGLHQLLDVPKVTYADIEEQRRCPNGRLFISPRRFQYDFEQRRDSEFNTEATYVFAGDFRLLVLRDGWYQPPQFPKEFLDQDYIEFTLFRHLEYVHDVYANLKNPASTADKLSKEANTRRTTRRLKRYLTCESVLLSTPSLERYHPIYQQMGVGSVNSDETDSEMEEGADKRLKRITLGWRGHGPNKLHRRLDEMVEKGKVKGVKGVPAFSFHPFERIPSDKVDNTSLPPRGLPRNCLEPSWLKTLRAAHCDRLFIKEDLYDFDFDFD